MPDLMLIVLFALPISAIFWVGAIFLVLMLIDTVPGVIEQAKARWRNRE
jgi:hypothetical protein